MTARQMASDSRWPVVMIAVLLCAVCHGVSVAAEATQPDPSATVDFANVEDSVAETAQSGSGATVDGVNGICANNNCGAHFGSEGRTRTPTDDLLGPCTLSWDRIFCQPYKAWATVKTVLGDIIIAVDKVVNTAWAKISTKLGDISLAANKALSTDDLHGPFDVSGTLGFCHKAWATVTNAPGDIFHAINTMLDKHGRLYRNDPLFDRIVEALYKPGSVINSVLLCINWSPYVGTFTLVVAPLSKFVDAICLVPAMIVTAMYCLNFAYVWNGYGHFFSLGGWMGAMEAYEDGNSRSVAMLMMQHWSVFNLLACYTITMHFYDNFAVTTVSRGIFMVVQIITSMLGPVGLFMYVCASAVVFSRLSKPTRLITLRRFTTAASRLRDELTKRVPTAGLRHLDTSHLPAPLKLIVEVAMFVVGLSSYFMVLGVYFFVMVPVLLGYWLVSFQNPTASAFAGVLAYMALLAWPGIFNMIVSEQTIASEATYYETSFAGILASIDVFTVYLPVPVSAVDAEVMLVGAGIGGVLASKRSAWPPEFLITTTARLRLFWLLAPRPAALLWIISATAALVAAGYSNLAMLAAGHSPALALLPFLSLPVMLKLASFFEQLLDRKANGHRDSWWVPAPATALVAAVYVCCMTAPSAAITVANVQFVALSTGSVSLAIFFLLPYFLEFSFIFEFARFGLTQTEHEFISFLGDHFNPTRGDPEVPCGIPFGNGIAFYKHGDCKKVMEDPDIRKGGRPLQAGWMGSEMLIRFAPYITNVQPKTVFDRGKVATGRAIIYAWLSQTHVPQLASAPPGVPSVPHELARSTIDKKPKRVIAAAAAIGIENAPTDCDGWLTFAQDRPEDASELIEELRKMRVAAIKARLNGILPYRPVDGSALDQKHVEMAWIQTFFHVLTDGELTKEELGRWHFVLKTPLPFFSGWINFLFGGGVGLRSCMHLFGMAQGAFARYAEADQMTAALRTANEGGWVDGAETARFLALTAIQSSVPGSNLLATTVNAMQKDPDKMVPAYKKDKDAFIKEIARLSECGPVVNMYTHEPETHVMIGGKTYTLPENTPLHASIVNANRDTDIFGRDAAEFNLSHDTSDILTWNGTEAAIVAHECPMAARHGAHEGPPVGHPPHGLGSVPPRHCPGHRISLDITQLLVDRFAPNLATFGAEASLDKVVKGVAAKQTWLTWILVKGGQFIIGPWNVNPPHASDVLHPSDALQKNLDEFEVPFAATFSPTCHTIPTYDEDVPGWFTNWSSKMLEPMLQSPFASMQDTIAEWTSPAECMQYRERVWGTNYPALSNHKLDEMDTSEALSQFAFAGFVSFRTRTLANYKKGVAVKGWRLGKVAPHDVATIADDLARRLQDAHGEGPVAHYVNESVLLSQYGVRKDFQRYGAAAFFDKDANLLGIYTCFNKELVIAPSDTPEGTRCITELTDARAAVQDAETAVQDARDDGENEQVLKVALESLAKAVTRAAVQDAEAAVQDARDDGEHEQVLKDALERLAKAVNANREYTKTTRVQIAADAPPQWKHAVWAWKVSSVTLTTIAEHLVYTHLTESTVLCTTSRKFLPQIHPLRAFLKIFTFHATTINYQAIVGLVSPKTLANRIYAFETDDLKVLFEDVRSMYEYVPMLERLDPGLRSAVNAEMISPLVNSVPDYYKAVRDLVDGYLRNLYHIQAAADRDADLQDFLDAVRTQLGIAPEVKRQSLDDIIDLLTTLICSVTEYHEHVGHLADIFSNPTFCGTTLRSNKEIDTVQPASLMMLLIAGTGQRMPMLMSNWGHLLSRDEYADESLTALRKFQDDLSQLSTKHAVRNRTRRFESESFNPATSISGAGH